MKHIVGHNQNGLANLLTTLHVFAFALPNLLDCCHELWQLCRQRAGSRHRFFEKLRLQSETVWFADWTALLQTVLGERRRMHAPPRPDAARPPSIRPAPGSCGSP